MALTAIFEGRNVQFKVNGSTRFSGTFHTAVKDIAIAPDDEHYVTLFENNTIQLSKFRSGSSVNSWSKSIQSGAVSVDTDGENIYIHYNNGSVVTYNFAGTVRR